MRDITTIYNDLLGTCESLAAYLERNDIDEDPVDIQPLLEDEGLYLCTVCGWWVEESDMRWDGCDAVCNEC